MKFNDLADKIAVGLARVGRSLQKPEVRAKVDVECDIYPDSDSETPSASIKVKNEPKMKLWDLFLAAVALRAVYRLLRAVFRD